MADSVVAGALKFPQDDGFPNLTDGDDESWDSAGFLMALAQAVDSGSYVKSGSEMTFTGHDAGADQVDVTSGRAFLDMSGVTVNVQSGTGTGSVPAYDTALSSAPAIMVELPSTVTNLDVQDSTLSQVWLAYATDDTLSGSGITAGDIYLRSDDTGSVTAPPHPNVELGEANPDNASADTLKNRFGSPTLGELDVVNETLIKATLSSDQSLTSGSRATLALDTVAKDERGEFDTANNKFVVDETGWYHVSAQVYYQVASDQDDLATDLRNSTDGASVATNEADSSGTGPMTHVLSGIFELSAGDDYIIRVLNNSSSDSVASGTDQTFLCVRRAFR